MKKVDYLRGNQYNLETIHLSTDQGIFAKIKNPFHIFADWNDEIYCFDHGITGTPTKVLKFSAEGEYIDTIIEDVEGCNSIEVNQDGIFLFRISDQLMKNWNPSEPFAWYSNESKMDRETWKMGREDYDSSILEKVIQYDSKGIKIKEFEFPKNTYGLSIFGNKVYYLVLYLQFRWFDEGTSERAQSVVFDWDQERPIFATPKPLSAAKGKLEDFFEFYDETLIGEIIPSKEKLYLKVQKRFSYLIYANPSYKKEHSSGAREKSIGLRGEDWIQFNLKTRKSSEIIPPKEASFPFLEALKNAFNICKNHIDQWLDYQRDPEIVLVDPATNVVVCSDKNRSCRLPLDPSKPMDQGHWNDDFFGDSSPIERCNYFDGELAFEELGNIWISNNRMKNLSPQELDRFIQSLSDDQLAGYCFRDPRNNVHDIDVHKYPELSRLEEFTIIMDNAKKNVSNMRNNLYSSHKKDIYDSVEHLLENSTEMTHNDYPNVPMPLLNSYSQNYIMKNNCGSRIILPKAAFHHGDWVDYHLLNQLYWLHPSQWLDKKVGEKPVLIFPNGKIYTEAQLEQLERADRGFSFLEEDFDDSEDFYFEEEFF